MDKKLTLSYDKDADVLYMSFGAPQKAISEESEEGILIRRHPDTREVVGVTIIDFEKRFSSLQQLPITLEETLLFSKAYPDEGRL